MSKKQKMRLQAGHHRFEIKFIVDLREPLKLTPSCVLEGRTTEGNYVAVPADAQVKELPMVLLPDDQVKSRTNGTRFWVVSGPHMQHLGDTVLPAYLVHDDFGSFSLIREELLEPDA